MKIGFVGVGNMGSAILKGYYHIAQKKKDIIFVFDENKEKMQTLLNDMQMLICKDVKELASKSEIIILGVKPKDFKELLFEIKPELKDETILVSMAAGISIDYIRKHIGDKAQIIRIMPNTPAFVNEGVTSISRENTVTDEKFDEAKSIFEGIGKVFEVEEEKIHAVIGVSGSSPAYTYMYIDALANAAEKRGMDRAESLEFAAVAVMGAAKMIIETGTDPAELIKNVCSPNGTTIEAVKKLEELDFYEVIDSVFEAAFDKSKEITK